MSECVICFIYVPDPGSVDLFQKQLMRTLVFSDQPLKLVTSVRWCLCLLVWDLSIINYNLYRDTSQWGLQTEIFIFFHA